MAEVSEKKWKTEFGVMRREWFLLLSPSPEGSR